MRLNLEHGINDCQLIYDTYYNDWACLKNVLLFTTQQAFIHKKTLILPDLYPGELASDILYEEVAQFLHDHKIHQLIAIGPQLKSHAEKFQFLKAYFFDDVATLLASQLLDTLYKNVVIVKGGGGYNLSELLDKIRQKCHDAVLEIDLDAIEHNLNFFRGRLSKNTQVIAMLKASAYGSSSFEVAHFLQQCQVAYLSVAYVDEGVILREAGIKLPIMVMNPSPGSFNKLLDYQLEPVIYSLKLLKDWKNFIDGKGIHIPIHIKLDTGMHRLGFMEHDMDELVYLLQCMPNIYIKTVLSHLAAPGTRRHDAYTHAQAKLFQQMASYIEKKLGVSILKDLLNTAGAQYFPEYNFDMVRLGIGLYGFSKEVQEHLKIASTLKTIISQIKEVPAGATIGYERKGVVQRPSRIAVLAIGYADGFRRGLSNGVGKVWINGKLAPVIGNVCMDMCMVDITDIEAREGDEVIIFGKELPIHEMASALNTIVYEILTNVDERVKRVCYKVLPACR
ncbi:MAG: alanine racemase [Candidatus Amoebophilus sp. 36-38]|nr:MAG: alanine racemase [Candidatus Amoebophilus sp. 36-38]